MRAARMWIGRSDASGDDKSKYGEREGQQAGQEAARLSVALWLHRARRWERFRVRGKYSPLEPFTPRGGFTMNRARGVPEGDAGRNRE